ncbi:MAG: hypothetical protein U9Q06_04540 [Nanoarchaeota archaeon]|nr:hypothetical protein [Nanoarchaeota archaeon]
MTDSEILSAYFNGGHLEETPLKRLLEIRQSCIDQAVSRAVSGWGVSFSGDFEDIERQYPDIVKDGLTGQTVIELGPVHRPVYMELKKFDISRYVAVEPFEPRATGGALNHILDQVQDGDAEFERMKLSDKDGLSYLITQPDKSAVVMSYGVFCPDLQHGNGLYVRFLAKEIHRVTPENGITIHCGNPGYDLHSLFKQVGFQIAETRQDYVALGIKKS